MPSQVIKKYWRLSVFALMCLIIGFYIGIQDTQSTPMAAPTYAPINLIIDDIAINFSPSTPVYLIEGTPMAPMRELFSTLGAQVNWFPESQQMTAYLRNAFIKFQLGNSSAYYNGMAMDLVVAPLLIDNTAYIPIEPVATAFDFHFAYTDGSAANAQINTNSPLATSLVGLNKPTAILKSRNIKRYYYLSNTFFETQTFPNQPFTMALPYGWLPLSNQEQSYGIQDEYDDYSMHYEIISNPTNADILSLANTYKSNLANKYGPSLTIQSESRVAYNGISFEVVDYRVTNASSERTFVSYLTAYNDISYLFEGSFSSSSDFSYMQEIFSAAMSTLQFNSGTILTQNEHYVEYPAFINLGTQLSSPLMSNQDMFEWLKFAGHISYPQKVKSLYARVYKSERDEQDQITQGTQAASKGIIFDIPISVDGTFNGKIYTPFGLGRHLVEVYNKPADGSADQLLMQFSIINLSDRVTQYLIPSEHIQSEQIEVASLAKYLGLNKSSEYGRAKAMFDWITQKIKLTFTYGQPDTSLKRTPPTPLRDVLIQKEANTIEINLLLSAMLRSQNIQARTVSGQIADQTYVFVEANINGTWVVIDPVSHLMADRYPHLALDTFTTNPINAFKSYHYIDLATYRDLFDAFTIVE